ncbi:MAG: FkbM family methyltransferase [Methylacidiphilales bacterium]|nr:FkbM family methyltransferase [Candidatus Methylacidiphilales bacterium]
MRQLIKRTINRLLRPAHLELRGINAPRLEDPFWVQTRIIRHPHPVIFDVGAHEGEICELYLHLFPGCSLHAFEPGPDAHQKLQSRLKNNPSVRLNQTAVSDVEGTVAMNFNSSTATSSLLASDPRAAEAWGTGLLDTQSVGQVPSTTLDAYCRSAKIEAIDILKLDIQGAELKALYGASGLLESRRVGLVYMEIILTPTYRGQPSLEDYLRFFHGVGYDLLDFYHPVHKDLSLIQSDMILVPRPQEP